MEATVDGCPVGSEHEGRLGTVETVTIPQEHHLSVLGFESAERRLQHLGLLLSYQPRIRFGGLGGQVVEGVGGHLMGTSTAADPVARDAEQPRSELGRLSELVDGRHGAQEGVLYRVLGVVAAAGPHAEVEQLGGIAVICGAERSPVAGPHPRYQLDVGRRCR